MTTLIDRVTSLLYEEAAALDERRWDDWLALFATGCEYWAPTWKSEDETTSDPRRELSLIYYANRGGLEDRVWRVQSGRAASSAVLPRTQHVVSNIRLVTRDQADEATIHVASNWVVHQFLPMEKAVDVFFGRYEHTLTIAGDALLIARKKIILLNDYLPSKLDFYNL